MVYKKARLLCVKVEHICNFSSLSLHLSCSQLSNIKMNWVLSLFLWMYNKSNIFILRKKNYWRLLNQWNTVSIHEIINTYSYTSNATELSLSIAHICAYSELLVPEAAAQSFQMKYQVCYWADMQLFCLLH